MGGGGGVGWGGGWGWGWWWWGGVGWPSPARHLSVHCHAPLALRTPAATPTPILSTPPPFISPLLPHSPPRERPPPPCLPQLPHTCQWAPPIFPCSFYRNPFHPTSSAPPPHLHVPLPSIRLPYTSTQSVLHLLSARLPPGALLPPTWPTPFTSHSESLPSPFSPAPPHPPSAHSLTLNIAGSVDSSSFQLAPHTLDRCDEILLYHMAVRWQHWVDSSSFWASSRSTRAPRATSQSPGTPRPSPAPSSTLSSPGRLVLW